MSRNLLAMLRLVCAVSAAVLLPGLAATGQDAEENNSGFAADAFGVQIRPAEPQKNAEQPSVEELLRRLDAVEAEANAPPAVRDRGLVLMLAKSHLGSTNNFGEGGFRYFATGLILINLTDQPITVPTAGIVLQADGEEITLADATAKLSKKIIQVGGQAQRFVPPPDSLIVPGLGSASTTVAFAEIESASPVPVLKLVVTWAKGAEELDINAYQRGVLALKVERLGPHNCGSLLTICGELNSINAATLADALDALAAAGVVRAVIAWGEGAPAPDDDLLGWLSVGTSEDVGLQYAQLPRIPVSISEFHPVQPAGVEPDSYLHYDRPEMHRTVEAAMSAALRTAFASVPRDELRAELAHGHRLSRGAALAHAGSALGRRELPLVLAACDDSDAYVRLQALTALSQYSEPEAVERLVKAASSNDADIRHAAVAGLAGSRYPEAHTALGVFLDGLNPERAIEVVDVLARVPRREHIDRIAEYYRTGDVPLKLAALPALVRLGHPDLVEVLAVALGSADPELQSQAYVQLALRTDRKCEMLASGHALKLLKTSPPDGTTHMLLMRTRDRQALPALFKHLDSMTNGREQLIRLIIHVGGADVFPEVLARYSKLTSSEKATVLELLLAGKSSEIRPLAFEAILAGDLHLMDVSARVLATYQDENTVQELAAALQTTTSPEAWSGICRVLATVGDNAARDVLLNAASKTNDPRLREQLAGGLATINSTSPGAAFSFQADEQIEQGEYQRAVKLLDLAISFDPYFGQAYSKRGNVKLLQQKFDEALADFERAQQVDPFDSYAFTGRALTIVMQGNPAEGVRQVREAAKQYPDDATFEYNSACVYARASEQLQGKSSDDEVRLRDEYQTEAIEHLRNAMLLGMENVDFIRKDPDLVILKEVQEFENLLANPPMPSDVEGDGEFLPGEFELDLRVR